MAKVLKNNDNKEWTLPGTSVTIFPGKSRRIGDGRGEIPLPLAQRMTRAPWFVIEEVADTPVGASDKKPDASGAGAGAGQGPAVNASKGALAAAEAAGLDLAVIVITGTGKEGQITKPDVDAFIAERKAAGEE